MKSLTRTARTHGVGLAAKSLLLSVRCRLMALGDRRFEKRIGWGTRQSVPLGQLTIESQNRELGFPYVATPRILFEAFMANLPKDLGDYSFVDFGSGKGRVLLLALQHGFKEIIGVEFARELHEVAVANVARQSAQDPGAGRITCLQADACDFPIPEGKCVLYFANPFAEPVMARVLGNIEESYRLRPRKIYVFYMQFLPELEDDPSENLAMLDAARFLTPRPTRFPSLWSRWLLATHTLAIYETAEPVTVHRWEASGSTIKNGECGRVRS